MGKFFKVKKINIAIFLLLIFNQFLCKVYSLNNKKTYRGEITKNIFLEKYNNEFFELSNKKMGENIFTRELLVQSDADNLELEKMNNKNDNLEEKANLEKLNNKNLYEDLKKKYITNIDVNDKRKFKDSTEKENLEKLNNKNLYEDLKPEYTTINDKKINNKSKDNGEKSFNKLPLPSKSKIFSSEFNVPPRGYVNLKGPSVSLNLQGADSFETLKLIGKLGNYGIVIIEENNNQNEKSTNNPKITASFDNADISDVFNSILLSSNMQAIVEKNIIFIGKNIINKSLKSKVSKTYRLNQVNAASVADYLSTLGARISKVMLLSGSIDGQEVSDSLVNKKEFEDEVVNPYGIERGPLFGLIGTADLRLQTINLIGSNELLNTADKYIKALDIRHRQVALTIKIIDVTLSKSDIKDNVFELRTGDTRIINNSGLSLRTGNMDPGNPPITANIPNIITGGVTKGNFLNWLEAKITNENAKILASPTLILGENPNILASGAANVDDSLSAASIGRPFKNEGFIKVGETVVTGFEQTANEGVVTCTAREGTAGITFGAKVDKIDDNGYVTFALSPAISSVTKSVEISGCGIQNTLSVRKLDTGSIRVKNEDTLILTGVLQDSDNVTTSKVPILGDIPILGSLFRNNSRAVRKSELIILVTPRILKDE